MRQLVAAIVTMAAAQAIGFRLQTGHPRVGVPQIAHKRECGRLDWVLP